MVNELFECVIAQFLPKRSVDTYICRCLMITAFIGDLTLVDCEVGAVLHAHAATIPV